LKLLKDKNNLPITSSQRKTGFNGLIICLMNMNNLIDDILKPKMLDFILFYKMSQDHIEMLFSAIRSRGDGFNNNPTAAKFESGYKRLLIHTEISVSDRANCAPQDSTNILHVSSSTKKGEKIF